MRCANLDVCIHGKHFNANLVSPANTSRPIEWFGGIRHLVSAAAVHCAWRDQRWWLRVRRLNWSFGLGSHSFSWLKYFAPHGEFWSIVHSFIYHWILIIWCIILQSKASDIEDNYASATIADALHRDWVPPLNLLKGSLSPPGKYIYMLSNAMCGNSFD